MNILLHPSREFKHTNVYMMLIAGTFKNKDPRTIKSMHREVKEEKKNKALSTIGLKANPKIIRPKFAVGGFDQDLMEWGGDGKVDRKSKKKMESREKEFSDFDPEKRLRKQGKVGKASFKSKSKFKRRK